MTIAQTQTLDEFLRHCQHRVKHRLSEQLQADIISQKLKNAMQYACLGGGKRIRPVLTYAAALAVGGSLRSADNAAAAVELIHSYSLVHDDLPAMDDDDLRRSKPTVHKAYDEATAILVGDALQSLAFQLLSADSERANTGKQLAMVQLLSRAAGAAGMVGGQSLDFEAVGGNLDLLQLEQMHQLKTGALISCSVLLGGMSHSQVTESQMAALSTYASNIGLAFQVQDDILDVVSDTAILGKPQGSDQEQGKPTYASLLGLEAAKQLAAKLSAQATAALALFSDGADQLRELASYVVRRQH